MRYGVWLWRAIRALRSATVTTPLRMATVRFAAGDHARLQRTLAHEGAREQQRVPIRAARSAGPLPAHARTPAQLER